MLIRWQGSLSQLDTTMKHLEANKNLIADALSRMNSHIKIPPTRDSTSPPHNRHSSPAQLPVIRNHLTSPTPYVYMPLPTIISYTTMSSQLKHRIPAGNGSRRYDEDDTEYWELLDIDYQEDDGTRALPNQLQQAARANRQPLPTLSGAAVNRLRHTATPAAVATNATTTRAHTQQHSLVIEELKPRKLLHSLVLHKEASLLNRPPTIRPNHIPLNQVGADETSAGRSSPFAAPSQYRHATSLMQELSAEDFSSDEKPESGMENMADAGEESEMLEWEREGAEPRSVEEMVQDIRRTPPYKRTEVLSPAALVEERKKSCPTCKYHDEQFPAQHPPLHLLLHRLLRPCLPAPAGFVAIMDMLAETV